MQAKYYKTLKITIRSQIIFSIVCLLYTYPATALLLASQNIQGGPNSKPLLNDQKIVLNRIKAYQ